MNMTVWKRAGVAIVATAVVTGVAGCQDGDAKSAGQTAGQAAGKGVGDVTEALTAAFKKTSEAKAAKFRMTIETTGAGAGAGAGAGTMTMTGVQGWDPTVLDVTMSGGALAGAGAGGGQAGMPDKIHMLMRDDVMYMDMGDKLKKDFDGKRWMKMDFGAMAEESGDASLKAMTANMSGTNQDPAQQLALLLEAPGIKHIGPEKVEGVDTEHYKGSVTFEQMMNSNKNLDHLSAKDRQALVDSMKKAGVKGYDTELWVDKEGYPAKMLVGIQTAQGAMKLTAFYSDYGTKAAVTPPPAGDTLDFVQMMKDLGTGAGAAQG